MECLLQLGSVPRAYAVVAGGCDWPLPPTVGLSNNDVIALRALRQFGHLCYVSYVSYAACVALDGNTALQGAQNHRCNSQVQFSLKKK